MYDSVMDMSHDAAGPEPGPAQKIAPPPAMARPAVDLANPMLGPAPAMLDVANVTTPEGSQVVMTVRTSSSTTTVFLTKEQAEEWGRILNRSAAQLSGLIVPGGPPFRSRM